MTFSYICRMKRDLRRCDRVMIKGGRYGGAIGTMDSMVFSAPTTSPTSSGTLSWTAAEW